MPVTNGTDYFSDEESEILNGINIASSSFSVIGSTLIIFCYLKFRSLRSFAFTLVLWLSVSDVGYSIANFFGDAGGPGFDRVGSDAPLCQAQAWLLSFFGLSSLLWAVAIAFTLHMAVLRSNPTFAFGEINKLRLRYHVAIWSFSGLLTILPALTSSYGDVGAWCWISRSAEGAIAWRVFQLYLWVVVGVVYSIWVYAHVHAKIKSSDSGDRGSSKMLRRIKYYPMVLAASWFFGIINDSYETFTGGRKVMWLTGLHIWFSSLNGVYNAIVYGLTPQVKTEVKRFLNLGGEQPLEELEEEMTDQPVSQMEALEP